MISVLFLLLAVTFGCLSYVTHRYSESRKLLREALETLEENKFEIKKYQDLYNHYYALYNAERRKNYFSEVWHPTNQPTVASVTEEIMEAVKYAVIKSHPDNGGNTDDFVKFRQCYQELKEKQK